KAGKRGREFARRRRPGRRRQRPGQRGDGLPVEGDPRIGGRGARRGQRRDDRQGQARQQEFSSVQRGAPGELGRRRNIARGQPVPSHPGKGSRGAGVHDAGATPPVPWSLAVSAGPTMPSTAPLVWEATIALIVGLLAFDYVFHVRKAHGPSLREAAVWSALYVGIALLIGVAVWPWGGAGMGAE